MVPARYDAHVPTHDEAVRLLEEQHADLAALFAELDTESFVRRGTMGGGDWSAKDLAAHMGLWEEFALATIDEFGRGERPTIERMYESHTGDQLNEQGVERFVHAPAPDVLARFDDLHRRLVSAIDSMSENEWAAEYPFDPDDRTLGDRIGSLLGSERGAFMHASAHLPDLRAYVDAIRR
jgi:Mycothiol maleylpyruvate isomerase N-terminal domain